MKKFSALFSSSFVIYLFIVALIVVQIIFPPRPNRTSYSYLPPLEALVRDSLMMMEKDSLLYTEYQKIEGSVRRHITEENENNFSHGTGWGVLSVGISSFEDDSKKASHYVRSTAYYLKEDDFQFFSKNGRNYIKYTVWDKKEGDVRSGYTAVTETPVKLVKEENNTDWTILFPVSGSMNVLHVVFPIVAAFLMVAGLIFYLQKPLKILLNISRGDAFSDYNIKNLYNIAWFTLLVGLLSGVIKIVVHLLFKSQVPEQLSFSYYIALMTGSEAYIAALVILLVAKAFDDGQKLQEENDLTV